MASVFTAQQLQQADRNAAEKFGLPVSLLMQRAARALLDACLEHLPQPAPVVILCGKGNNGGDGICLEYLLKERQYPVTALRLPEEADRAKAVLPPAALVVDCLFGTGFHGRLPEPLLPVLDLAREKPVLACDLPSGVECDTGRTDPACLKAIQTVTFAGHKPCFFLYPAKEYCGRITVADIGIPAKAFPENGPQIETLTEEDVRTRLRPRPENGHKGTFGSLQAVCGSDAMTGAAILSAAAALRTGVGLLYLSLPESIRPILQAVLPEPVYAPRRTETGADALLIGCGMGRDRETLDFYRKQSKPKVLDADALNLMAETGDWEHLDETCVLTPHPGEFARMTQTTVTEIEADRLSAVLRFTQKCPGVLVLKGHHTLVAQQGRVRFNTTGNTALAKGGSGDVLAGFIAGFLAQGYSAWDSALCGVFLHGKAAEIGAKQFSESGLLPSQLPELAARQLSCYHI